MSLFTAATFVEETPSARKQCFPSSSVDTSSLFGDGDTAAANSGCVAETDKSIAAIDHGPSFTTQSNRFDNIDRFIQEGQTAAADQYHQRQQQEPQKQCMQQQLQHRLQQYSQEHQGQQHLQHRWQLSSQQSQRPQQMQEQQHHQQQRIDGSEKDISTVGVNILHCDGSVDTARAPKSEAFSEAHLHPAREVNRSSSSPRTLTAAADGITCRETAPDYLFERVSDSQFPHVATATSAVDAAAVPPAFAIDPTTPMASAEAAFALPAAAAALTRAAAALPPTPAAMPAVVTVVAESPAASAVRGGNFESVLFEGPGLERKRQQQFSNSERFRPKSKEEKSSISLADEFDNFSKEIASTENMASLSGGNWDLEHDNYSPNYARKKAADKTDAFTRDLSFRGKATEKLDYSAQSFLGGTSFGRDAKQPFAALSEQEKMEQRRQDVSVQPEKKYFTSAVSETDKGTEVAGICRAPADLSNDGAEATQQTATQGDDRNEKDICEIAECREEWKSFAAPTPLQPAGVEAIVIQLQHQSAQIQALSTLVEEISSKLDNLQEALFVDEQLSPRAAAETEADSAKIRGRMVAVSNLRGKGRTISHNSGYSPVDKYAAHSNYLAAQRDAETEALERRRIEEQREVERKREEERKRKEEDRKRREEIAHRAAEEQRRREELDAKRKDFLNNLISENRGSSCLFGEETALSYKRSLFDD